MINWYSEVSRSLAKIPDCVAYFDKELLEARKQCKIYGNLERAAAALPAAVEADAPPPPMVGVKASPLRKAPSQFSRLVVTAVCACVRGRVNKKKAR